MMRRRFDGSEDHLGMKRFAGLAIALVWLTLVPAPARDTYTRVPTIDALDYRIRLELKDAGDQIRGDTEILFAINEENLKSLTLDFADLAVDAVSVGDHAEYAGPRTKRTRYAYVVPPTTVRSLRLSRLFSSTTRSNGPPPTERSSSKSSTPTGSSSQPNLTSDEVLAMTRKFAGTTGAAIGVVTGPARR